MASRTVNLGQVGFGLVPDTKPLEQSLRTLKAFGKQVDALSTSTATGAQQMYSKFAGVERSLTSLMARTSAVTQKMRESGMAAPEIDKVSMAYKRLNTTLTQQAGLLSRSQIGRGTVGMSAILSAASKEATKMNQAGSTLTTIMRDLAGASVLAMGPLSGVGARLNVLSGLFDRNTVQMALFVAGAAGAAIGIGLIAAASIKAVMEQQRFDALLATSTGNTALAANEMNYLQDQSNKLGISVRELIEPYAKFTTAARLSGMALSDQKLAFEGAITAGRALHLSQEQLGRVFLAYEQMVSKGTVTTEELKRQLGDVLPGAFELAARAMGMTQAAFQKAMAAGEVLPNVMLPRLSRALKEIFGPAAEQASRSLAAEISRFSNALFELEKRFDSVSHFSQGFAAAVRLATSTLEYLATNMEKVFAIMGAVVGAGAGALFFSFLTNIVPIITAAASGLIILRDAIIGVGIASEVVGKTNWLGILIKLGLVAVGAAAGYQLMNQKLDPLLTTVQEFIDKNEVWLRTQEAIGHTGIQVAQQTKKATQQHLRNVTDEIEITKTLIQLEVERAKKAKEANDKLSRGFGGGGLRRQLPGPNTTEAETRLAALENLRDKLQREMARIGGLMLDVNPEDNGTSKAWDDWIKRIEKTIRSLDALSQETEEFAISGKDAEIAAEGMAKAIEIMEAMPEKGQGGLAVIAAHLREAGAEGVDLTHQLAALFQMIITKTGELKDLKAFPKLLETQTLAVKKMFDTIRARTAGAQDIISGIISPEDLAKTERLNELIVTLTDHLAKIHVNPDSMAAIVKELTDEFNLLTASEKAAKEIQDDIAKDKGVAEAIGQQIQNIEKETRLLGLTNNERARANDLMELEAHRASLSSEQFDFMAKALANLRDQQDKMNESWGVGARQALMQYAEDAKNTAQQIGDWFTGSFRQAEDAILNFVKTGKFEISDLANWIALEFARIAIRQLILAPIASQLGGLFGMGIGMGTGAAANVNAYSNMASAGAGAAGMAIPLATGSDYIPRNMLAYLHKGEQVVSAAENSRGRAGRGGGLVYAPRISIDSRTDRAEVQALVSRAVKQGNADLVERLHRAGSI